MNYVLLAALLVAVAAYDPSRQVTDSPFNASEKGCWFLSRPFDKALLVRERPASFRFAVAYCESQGGSVLEHLGGVDSEHAPWVGLQKRRDAAHYFLLSGRQLSTGWADVVNRTAASSSTEVGAHYLTAPAPSSLPSLSSSEQPSGDPDICFAALQNSTHRWSCRDQRPVVCERPPTNLSDTAAWRLFPSSGAHGPQQYSVSGVSTPMSRSAAAAFCKSAGADLGVLPRDSGHDLLRLVVNQFNGKLCSHPGEYWIGLLQGGQAYDPTYGTVGLRPEPPQAGEYYVATLVDGNVRFKAASPTAKREFLCTRKLPSPSVTLNATRIAAYDGSVELSVSLATLVGVPLRLRINVSDRALVRPEEDVITLPANTSTVSVALLILGVVGRTTVSVLPDPAAAHLVAPADVSALTLDAVPFNVNLSALSLSTVVGTSVDLQADLSVAALHGRIFSVPPSSTCVDVTPYSFGAGQNHTTVTLTPRAVTARCTETLLLAHRHEGFAPVASVSVEVEVDPPFTSTVTLRSAGVATDIFYEGDAVSVAIEPSVAVVPVAWVVSLGTPATNCSGWSLLTTSVSWVKGEAGSAKSLELRVGTPVSNAVTCSVVVSATDSGTVPPVHLTVRRKVTLLYLEAPTVWCGVAMATLHLPFLWDTASATLHVTGGLTGSVTFSPTARTQNVSWAPPAGSAQTSYTLSYSTTDPRFGAQPSWRILLSDDDRRPVSLTSRDAWQQPLLTGTSWQLEVEQGEWSSVFVHVNSSNLTAFQVVLSSPDSSVALSQSTFSENDFSHALNGVEAPLQVRLTAAASGTVTVAANAAAGIQQQQLELRAITFSPLTVFTPTSLDSGTNGTVSVRLPRLIRQGAAVTIDAASANSTCVRVTPTRLTLTGGHDGTATFLVEALCPTTTSVSVNWTTAAYGITNGSVARSVTVRPEYTVTVVSSKNVVASIDGLLQFDVSVAPSPVSALAVTPVFTGVPGRLITEVDTAAATLATDTDVATWTIRTQVIQGATLVVGCKATSATPHSLKVKRTEITFAVPAVTMLLTGSGFIGRSREAAPSLGALSSVYLPTGTDVTVLERRVSAGNPTYHYSVTGQVGGSSRVPVYDAKDTNYLGFLLVRTQELVSPWVSKALAPRMFKRTVANEGSGASNSTHSEMEVEMDAAATTTFAQDHGGTSEPTQVTLSPMPVTFQAAGTRQHTLRVVYSVPVEAGVRLRATSDIAGSASELVAPPVQLLDQRIVELSGLRRRLFQGVNHTAFFAAAVPSHSNVTFALRVQTLDTGALGVAPQSLTLSWTDRGEEVPVELVPTQVGNVTVTAVVQGGPGEHVRSSTFRVEVLARRHVRLGVKEPLFGHNDTAVLTVNLEDDLYDNETLTLTLSTNVSDAINFSQAAVSWDANSSRVAHEVELRLSHLFTPLEWPALSTQWDSAAASPVASPTLRRLLDPVSGTVVGVHGAFSGSAAPSFDLTPATVQLYPSAQVKLSTKDNVRYVYVGDSAATTIRLHVPIPVAPGRALRLRLATSSSAATVVPSVVNVTGEPWAAVAARVVPEVPTEAEREPAMAEYFWETVNVSVSAAAVGDFNVSMVVEGAGAPRFHPSVEQVYSLFGTTGLNVSVEKVGEFNAVIAHSGRNESFHFALHDVIPFGERLEVVVTATPAFARVSPLRFDLSRADPTGLVTVSPLTDTGSTFNITLDFEVPRARTTITPPSVWCVAAPKKAVLFHRLPPEAARFYREAPAAAYDFSVFVPTPRNPHDEVGGENATLQFTWSCNSSAVQLRPAGGVTSQAGSYQFRRKAGGLLVVGAHTYSDVSASERSDSALHATFSVVPSAAIASVECTFRLTGTAGLLSEYYVPVLGMDPTSAPVAFELDRRYGARRQSTPTAPVLDRRRVYRGEWVAFETTIVPPSPQSWGYHCLNGSTVATALRPEVAGDFVANRSSFAVDAGTNETMVLAGRITPLVVGGSIGGVFSEEPDCYCMKINDTAMPPIGSLGPDAIAMGGLENVTFIDTRNAMRLTFTPSLEVPRLATVGNGFSIPGHGPTNQSAMSVVLSFSGGVGALFINSTDPSVVVDPVGHSDPKRVRQWRLTLPLPPAAVSTRVSLGIFGLTETAAGSFACAVEGAASLAFSHCDGANTTRVAGLVTAAYSSPHREVADSLTAHDGSASPLAADVILFEEEAFNVTVSLCDAAVTPGSLSPAVSVDVDGRFVAVTALPALHDERCSNFSFAFSCTNPSSLVNHPLAGTPAGVALGLPGKVEISFRVTQQKQLFLSPKPLRAEVRSRLVIRGAALPPQLRIGDSNKLRLALAVTGAPTRERLTLNLTADPPAAVEFIPAQLIWNLGHATTQWVDVVGRVPGSQHPVNVTFSSPEFVPGVSLTGYNVSVLDLGVVAVVGAPSVLFAGQATVLRLSLDHAPLSGPMEATLGFSTAAASIAFFELSGPVVWEVGASGQHLVELSVGDGVRSRVHGQVQYAYNSTEFASTRCDGRACGDLTVIPQSTVVVAGTVPSPIVLFVGEALVVPFRMHTCEAGTTVLLSPTLPEFPAALSFSPESLSWECDRSSAAVRSLTLTGVEVQPGSDPTQGRTSSVLGLITESRGDALPLQYPRTFPALQVEVRTKAALSVVGFGDTLYFGTTGAVTVTLPRAPAKAPLEVQLCLALRGSTACDPAAFALFAINTTGQLLFPVGGALSRTVRVTQETPAVYQLSFSFRLLRGGRAEYLPPPRLEFRTGAPKVVSAGRVDAAAVFVGKAFRGRAAVDDAMVGTALRVVMTGVHAADPAVRLRFSPPEILFNSTLNATEFTATADAPGAYAVSFALPDNPPRFNSTVRTTFTALLVRPKINVTVTPETTSPTQFIQANNKRTYEVALPAAVWSGQRFVLHPTASSPNVTVAPAMINFSVGQSTARFSVFAAVLPPEAQQPCVIRLGFGPGTTLEFDTTPRVVDVIRFIPLNAVVVPDPARDVTVVDGATFLVPVVLTGAPPTGQAYRVAMAAPGSLQFRPKVVLWDSNVTDAGLRQNFTVTAAAVGTFVLSFESSWAESFDTAVTDSQRVSVLVTSRHVATFSTGRGPVDRELVQYVGSLNSLLLHVTMPVYEPSSGGDLVLRLDTIGDAGLKLSRTVLTFTSTEPYPATKQLSVEGAAVGNATLRYSLEGARHYVVEGAMLVHVLPLLGFEVRNVPAQLYAGTANQRRFSVRPSVAPLAPLTLDAVMQCSEAVVAPASATWPNGSSHFVSFDVTGRSGVPQCLLQVRQRPALRLPYFVDTALAAPVVLLSAPTADVLVLQRDGTVTSTVPASALRGELQFQYAVQHAPLVNASAIVATSDKSAAEEPNGFAALVRRGVITVRYAVNPSQTIAAVTIVGSPLYTTPLGEGVVFALTPAAVANGTVPDEALASPVLRILGDGTPAPVKTTETAAETSAFVAALLGGAASPLAAGQAGRILGVTSFLECPSEDWREAQLDLPLYWSVVPLRLGADGAVGEAQLGGYAGSVVANAATVGLVALLQYGMVWLLLFYRRSRWAKDEGLGVAFGEPPTLRGACATMHFPALLWFPAVLLYAPTVVASVRVLLYSDAAGYKIIAAVAVILWGVGLPIALAYSTVAAFSLEYTPPGGRGLVRRALEHGTYTHTVDSTWMRRFGAPFHLLRGRARWYALAETIGLGLIALVAGVQPKTDQGCLMRGAVAVVLFAAHVVVCAVVQPFEAVLDTLFAVCVFACEVAAVSLLFGAHIAGLDRSSTTHDIVSIVLTAVGAALVLKALIDAGRLLRTAWRRFSAVAVPAERSFTTAVAAGGKAGQGSDDSDHPVELPQRRGRAKVWEPHRFGEEAGSAVPYAPPPPLVEYELSMAMDLDPLPPRRPPMARRHVRSGPGAPRVPFDLL